MSQTPPLTEAEAETLRQQLAAHDAAQAEVAKAANRALLAPLVGLGLGGTDPLTCSLSGLASAVRTHALAIGPVDPEFPAYAVQVSSVIEAFDRRLRTMVANNAAAPEPVAPEEPQGE